jgi:hypothetical protein
MTQSARRLWYQLVTTSTLRTPRRAASAAAAPPSSQVLVEQRADRVGRHACAARQLDRPGRVAGAAPIAGDPDLRRQPALEERDAALDTIGPFTAEHHDGVGRVDHGGRAEGLADAIDGAGGGRRQQRRRGQPTKQRQAPARRSHTRGRAHTVPQ